MSLRSPIEVKGVFEKAITILKIRISVPGASSYRTMHDRLRLPERITGCRVHSRELLRRSRDSQSGVPRSYHSHVEYTT